jgi:hypothetical protein
MLDYINKLSKEVLNAGARECHFRSANGTITVAMRARSALVRFGPHNRHAADITACSKCAMNRHGATGGRQKNSRRKAVAKKRTNAVRRNIVTNRAQS